MSKIYIFDLDGTVADCTHRLHYIKNGNHDWATFFKECVNDAPISEVINVATALWSSGYKIVFLSGRSDEVRNETEAWLDKYIGFSGPLYMRQQGNHEPDEQLKSKLLKQILKDDPNCTIMGIFDDRDKVVKMWRSKGYKVFQVGEGNF